MEPAPKRRYHWCLVRFFVPLRAPPQGVRGGVSPPRPRHETRLRLAIQIRAELMWERAAICARTKVEPNPHPNPHPDPDPHPNRNPNRGPNPNPNPDQVDVHVDTPALFKLVPMPLLEVWWRPNPSPSPLPLPNPTPNPLEAIVRRATRVVLDALLEVDAHATPTPTPTPTLPLPLPLPLPLTRCWRSCSSTRCASRGTSLRRRASTHYDP